MSNRKLILLAAIAVLMVIWAVIQSRIAAGPAAKPPKPGYLIMGLNPARIGSIVLGAGENAVTLKRKGPLFVVANKDDYPAKVTEINNLLTKCQEIRWSQIITDNPQNHDDLGVTEQSARIVVKFLTPEPNSTLLAGVVVGKSREATQGTYVRLLSSDQADSNKVYLAPSVPWISTAVSAYIERELLAVKRDEIESVTLTAPKEQYTLKAKPDGKQIILENMPPGKKLKDSAAHRVFTALTHLRFDDVRKNPSGLNFNRQYICKLKNSTVYTINIAKKNGKNYVSCQAAFTGTVRRPQQDESEQQLKEKETKLQAWDQANKFSEKHKNWIYQIPDWEIKDLTSQLSDLLEDVEKPAEPNTLKIEKSKKPPEPNAVKTAEPNILK